MTLDTGTPDRQYEVMKPLAEEMWLVQHRDDLDARFLGLPDDLHEKVPQLAALLDRGARWALDDAAQPPESRLLMSTIHWEPLLANDGARAAPRRLMP